MTARRWTLWRVLALVVLAALLIACGALWWLLAGSRARLDGRLQLAGLRSPVSVQRDALGTVTLIGKSRADLSYALGYVHAQERFFEMDLMRRMPAGELSALVGPAALKADLNHRRHRLRAVASTAYAQLPPAQKQQLDRYRDGVNAGLAGLRMKPWEYLLLGSRPQPWRSQDSLLLIAAMYLDLNGDGLNARELHIAQMRTVLPGALVDFLLSPDPDWEAPLHGRLSRSPVIPTASVFDLRRFAPAKLATEPADLTAALAPALDAPRPGSNSFAVSGALTQDGAAILANDMHLGLRAPNIWFRTRLRYPDPSAPQGQRDVNGVGLPGTPAIVVGSNGQLAWGFTNSYGDWLDWFRVRRDPNDADRYEVPGGWATIERHVEHIKVKGQPDTLLTVEGTCWGPIMGSDADGTPLALAWVGAAPRNYNLALMQMEQSPNLHEALRLAPLFGIPVQNLLMADSEGHIGWTIAGKGVPLRGDGDPTVPVDGTRPGSGWQGWATPAQYPRIEEPAGGRLWTANNRTIGGDALALLGNGGHDLGARAQQIRDDLQARASFTPGSLLDIQLDDRAVFLSRWQGLLQETLAGSNDPDLRSLRQLTAHWNGRASTDSVDYRLVRAFRSEATKAVLIPFADRVAQRHHDFSWPGENSAEAAVWALVHAQPPYLLDPAYPDWHALLVASAKRVAADLGKQPGGLAARQWGEHNRSRIDHPLSAALPAWLARHLDMPSQPQPGDNNMPRVAAPAFGASERLDLAPGHEAHGILQMPGGQSDHPLSPFYGAGHADWANGGPTPLLPGPAQHELTLEPGA